MMTSLQLSIASFLMLFITLTGLAQASETNVEEQAKAVEGTAHIIEIRDFVFSPISVEVKAGDTITWTNFDIVPHTATAIDHSWDSGSLKLGESFTYTVTDDMQLDYFCLFHPMMKANLALEK